jgi:tetratricopeptide (TPR) repeat protein
LGDWDRAIVDYTAALLTDPSFASSLYGRGVARQKKGDTEGGEADLKKARGKAPMIADDFVRYGLK